MEGGGEGVVVLGVADAVAVMLLDRRPRDFDYRTRLPLDTSAYPAIPSRLSKGVDTRTGPKADVSAQICQGSYASTYQLAHCNVAPSPPPISFPEFPPQRPEPCRTQGNFEVGGVGSGEYHRSRSPSPTGSFSFRGGLHWPDRGSPYSIRHHNHRDSAAFVKSLRKYPSYPECSPSAELLQQLIKQTQEKYLLKTSHCSKSMRNFCEKPKPDQETKIQSKKIQSPARSKKNEAQKEDGTKERHEMRHGKAMQKGFRSGYKSPTPGFSKEIRARDTFDYLNNSLPRPPPGVASGDRQVIRSLRDSLREAFGERRPVTALPVCPTMRSRYEKHKLEHHSVCAKRSQADKFNAGHDPVPSSPKPWQFCGLPVASTSFSPEELLICCRCNKPLPCSCFTEDDMEEKRRLEDIVCSWLEELPVYAKENPHDKFIRDAVVKKLIDTISLIKDDEFDDKGKEIVKLSIARMPMWLPADEEDREAFKNKIADDLFNKIKSFRQRDRFKDSIAEWLETINFDNGEKIDKQKVTSDFSKALKEIALNRPSNDSVYREMLKSKIYDMLAVLPVRSSFLKNDILNLLSDKLADLLIRLPQQRIKPDAEPTGRDEIETILMDSFKNNPVINALGEEVKQKEAKKLTPTLENILLNQGGKNVDEEIHSELRNWLSKLAKDEGLQIDDKDKGSFIENLASKLNAPQISKKLKEEEKAGELEQPLLDWLSELPGAPDSSKFENRKMIKELANEIQDCQQSGDETELIRRVGNWLRNSGKKLGVDIHPGSEEEFAKKIIPKISQLSKTRKRWSRNSQSIRFLNLTSDDPQLKQALMDNIHDVINESHVNVKNREDVESKLNDVLADLVMRGTDDGNTKDQIVSILEHANVSGDEANNISDKLIARAYEMSRSLKTNDMSSDFISNDKPSATSTPQKQNRSKSYEEKKYHNDLNTQIQDWINKQNLPIESDEKVEIAKDLANDLLDRQKYLQLNPEAKSSEKEEFEHLKYQLFKRLNKQVDSETLNTLMSKVDGLMKIIRQNPVPVLVKRQLDGDFKEERLVLDSNEFVQENLEGGILDWLRKSSISQQHDEKEKKKLEELVPDLAKTLTSTISTISTVKSEREADEILVNVIMKHLKKSLGSKKFSDGYIRKKAENLLKSLKDLQLFQNISIREHRAPEKSHMHQINEGVKKWCNELELPDNERTKQIKEDLGNRIMLKIGELNMNPQVLNDDILYEHMLSDFIDQELGKLPIDQGKTEEVKASLMEKVNEERLKVKHDYAGQVYKQQLRETISKAFPTMENPPASFEIMKDNLADDFINLKYSAGDEALQAKYKNKIRDEIDKFAKEYTKRYPDTPLSTDQLNRDLYNALNNVEVPDDNSMGSEVEQARIKDLIKDHLDEPLQKLSSTERLHANKMLTVLGKRLHEMEKENEVNPDENYEEIQRNEIEKYLLKIPFKDHVDISETTDKIMEEMKSTKHSRTFTASKRTSKLSSQKETPRRRSSSISHQPSWYPPSSLSVEDQEHLKIIRKRAQPCKIALQSGKCFCKPGNVSSRDAAVNPPPSDTGSQTDMVKENQSSQCNCPKIEVKTSAHRTPCHSRSQIISKPCTTQHKRVSTGSQIEISPYVVIKEYFWDSNTPEVKCPNIPERPSRSCQSSSYMIPPNKYGSQTCVTPEQPCAMPHNSSRPQVTRLGSFDENDHLENLAQPTPRRPYGQPLMEEFDWNSCTRNEQHSGFRPHFYRDEEQVEPERQNVKCGCKRKVFQCRGRKPVFCQTCRDDPMKFCAKCCGAQCPFPTNFYFR